MEKGSWSTPEVEESEVLSGLEEELEGKQWAFQESEGRNLVSPNLH